MLHLARKAFYPSTPPFPLVHVDTTWKFSAMYDVPRPHGRRARDGADRAPEPRVRRARHQPVRPRVGTPHRHVEDRRVSSRSSISTSSTCASAVPDATRRSRGRRSACSRSGPPQHQWDPKRQRPELWQIYNGRRSPGETLRVFPISNWTELDVWQYIHLEQIPIVPLYLAAPRPVVDRDGVLIMVDDDRFRLHDGEVPEMQVGAIPHPRLLPAVGCDRERCRHADRASSRRCCSPPRPSARAA